MKKKHRHKPPHSARAAGSPAVSRASANVDAQFQAAFSAHRAGRIDVAEAGYRAVLRAAPDYAHALNNLAILLKARRQLDEAETLYQRLLRCAPEAHSFSNYGCLLAERRRDADAVAQLRRAVALKPDYPDALFNLGNCLRNTGNSAGAMTSYTRALALRPDMAEALANKGDIHKEQAELSVAIDHFMAALRLRPDLPAPYNNLGEALKEQGRLEEAVTVFKKGLEAHPKEARMHSNLLLALNYLSNLPTELVFRAHVCWGQQHAGPLTPAAPRYANDRNPDRRLRIGYVSPDFSTHSCAYFSEPLIDAHDRREVEVFCYSTSHRQDVATDRFRALADAWRPIAGLDEESAAALIQQDRIDVLVDLAGHTCDHRLLVFARRPAPVQATWLGYPNTTGMTAIDYRLTDAIADPPGESDRLHTEKLVRLPGGFLTFRPVFTTPPQEIPPSLTAGHITFGSFNNASKVTPEVAQTWSAILARVPGSRLLLKSRQFGDPFTRRRFEQLFAAHGVGGERLTLLPRIEPAIDHLRAYDRLDVALDPFPYNGTTTTCEALWMGAPVVTLAGDRHVARVGASLLSRCGLDGLIAANPADYIDKAAALANDRSRLIELRRTMRSRLERSPLTDYAGFARSMEAAYRQMWRDWTARTPE